MQGQHTVASERPVALREDRENTMNVSEVPFNGCAYVHEKSSC